MKKFKVKLSLALRNVENKVEFGRAVHDAMNTNPNFTTPSPTLADLATACDDLETAFSARQSGAHLAVAQMHIAEADFDTLMTALGAYVDNVAQGAEDVILSAAMQTKKQPSSVGVPAKVLDVRGRALDVLGTISLRWKSVYGKKSYNVYMKQDGETDEQYKLVAQPTKASITFDDLESATYYWFRVEAVGSDGIGALSDGAKSIAL